MNQKKLIFIQICSELAIPLIGYFFWNWSLLFILIFYIIENLFLSFFRLETLHQTKIAVLRTKINRNYKQFLSSFFFWIFEFGLIHFFISTLDSNVSIGQEWFNFIMYQELGIPQGLLLIPLMFFASRMKMKQDVLLILKKVNYPDELNKKTINNTYSFVAIGFWGLLIGLNYLFHPQQIINLLLILLLLLFRALQRNDF
jgi:hypothetical protein